MIKPWLRRLLFWSFLTFFLIAAPISVFYTAGFRYNIQNNSIVRTGVISINTTPRNALIYVDEKNSEHTSPFIVKRLMPGNYNIRLEKDLYHDWTNEVEVKSGETSQIHGIMLYRDDDPKILFEKEPTLIVANSTSSLAYLVRQGGWSEIWLYNIPEDATRMIGRYLASSITEAAEIIWSQDGNYLMIFDSSSGHLSVYDSQGNQKTISTNLINQALRVFWHPSSDSLLEIVTSDETFQVDLDSGEETVIEDPDTLILDASIISFVDNGSQTELTQEIEGEKKLIALLPRAEYSIAKRENQYLLITDKRNKLYLINIRADQPILLETQAQMFDWHSDADLLVYSNGTEVNVYSPWDHSTTFITRQSDLIRNVLWHPSGRSILLATEHNLTAIERHQVGKTRQITNLLDNATIYEFWVEKNGRFAYFYGTFQNETGVFSLQLTR